jgi:hypothetical protein
MGMRNMTDRGRERVREGERWRKRWRRKKMGIGVTGCKRGGMAESFWNMRS